VKKRFLRPRNIHQTYTHVASYHVAIAKWYKDVSGARNQKIDSNDEGALSTSGFVRDA